MKLSGEIIKKADFDLNTVRHRTCLFRFGPKGVIHMVANALLRLIRTLQSLLKNTPEFSLR